MSGKLIVKPGAGSLLVEPKPFVYHFVRVSSGLDQQLAYIRSTICGCALWGRCSLVSEADHYVILTNVTYEKWTDSPLIYVVY